MTEKMTINITVEGPPHSGRRKIIREIASLLQSLSIDVKIDWGIDGPGSRYSDRGIGDALIRRIREHCQIVIKDVQTERASE